MTTASSISVSSSRCRDRLGERGVFLLQEKALARDRFDDALALQLGRKPSRWYCD